MLCISSDIFLFWRNDVFSCRKALEMFWPLSSALSTCCLYLLKPPTLTIRPNGPIADVSFTLTAFPFWGQVHLRVVVSNARGAFPRTTNPHDKNKSINIKSRIHLDRFCQGEYVPVVAGCQATIRTGRTPSQHHNLRKTYLAISTCCVRMAKK